MNGKRHGESNFAAVSRGLKIAFDVDPLSRAQAREEYHDINGQPQSTRASELIGSWPAAQPNSSSDGASPSSDSLSAISPRLRFIDVGGRGGGHFNLISARSILVSRSPDCLS